MSFVKYLKCYFCSTNRSLSDENFPEDLYDLISKYKTDQLLWVCTICKSELDNKMSSKSSKQLDFENILDMNTKIRKISSDSCQYYSSNTLESSQNHMADSGCESQSLSSLSRSSKKSKAACKYIPESSEDDSGCDFQSLPIMNSLPGSSKKNKTSRQYFREVSQVDDSACDFHSLFSLSSLSGSSNKNKISAQCIRKASPDDSQSESLPFFNLSGNSKQTITEPKYSREVSQDSGNDSQSLCSLKSMSLYESSKENKAGRKYIHEVLNKIKIVPKDDSLNKKIIISVLDLLLIKLKKEEEFSCVFNKFYYTGSAYNDLRIIAATEYDIDLILRLPNCINLMPDLFDETYAFAKVKWEASSNANVPAPVKKFLEKNSVNNYLSPQMILSWFQRHLDLALKEIDTYPQHVVSVVNSSSGPARTLVIDTTLGYSISIDLVPVFEFDYSLLNKTPFFGEIEKTMQDANRNKWYLVPKACQGEIGDVSLSTSRLSWRLDFPNAEKQILYKKECAKNVIKMLKILRDKRNWKSVASYYLKMVVMLEILKNPSLDHWNNGFVFERTLDALKELKTYLRNKNLPHFLTNQNLLFKLNSSECTDYSNYLNNIIPKIESDPETIVKFYF